MFGSTSSSVSETVSQNKKGKQKRKETDDGKPTVGAFDLTKSQMIDHIHGWGRRVSNKEDGMTDHDLKELCIELGLLDNYDRKDSVAMASQNKAAQLRRRASSICNDSSIQSKSRTPSMITNISSTESSPRRRQKSESIAPAALYTRDRPVSYAGSSARGSLLRYEHNMEDDRRQSTPSLQAIARDQTDSMDSMLEAMANLSLHDEMSLAEYSQLLKWQRQCFVAHNNGRPVSFPSNTGPIVRSTVTYMPSNYNAQQSTDRRARFSRELAAMQCELASPADEEAERQRVIRNWHAEKQQREARQQEKIARESMAHAMMRSGGMDDAIARVLGSMQDQAYRNM